MGKSNKVYLDYASSAPTHNKIIENATTLLSNNYNASSISEEGISNFNDIERCRNKLAEIINCKSSEIIWTSSASESNSIVINGFRKAWPNHDVYATAFEHDSILFGVDKIIEVNDAGFVKEEQLKNIKNSLVCIMLVNNEIFTDQTDIIKRNIEMLHNNHNYVLCDASAAFGKIDIDVQELGVDYLVVSATKVGGIKGCSGLFIKDGSPFMPTIYGTQNESRHGSSYNWTAIRAFEYVLDDMIEFREAYEDVYWKDVKGEFIVYLLQQFGQRVKVNGDIYKSSPFGINIMLDTKLTSQQIVGLLEMSGFVVSSGSACSSYEPEPSHVLKAIHLTDEEANRSIRVSWGRDIQMTWLISFANALRVILDMNM